MQSLFYMFKLWYSVLFPRTSELLPLISVSSTQEQKKKKFISHFQIPIFHGHKMTAFSQLAMFHFLLQEK
jgi:hypothetical protein